MQQSRQAGGKAERGNWRRWLLLGLILAVGILLRSFLWQIVLQLFYGMLMALFALPLMRLMEKKCGAGLAAAVSLLGLGGGVVLALLVFLPMLAQQARQLLALFPEILERFSGWIGAGERWLAQNGLLINDDLRRQLSAGGQALISRAVPAAVNWIREKAGGFGRWMLAPVLGFYFLRDSRQIREWLLLLVPAEKRSMSVHLLREIRRETLGFLRGQLMISLVVGGLTAVGLLFCGIPAWLLLGSVMGVMELIPYVGPFVGGAVVVLFSLQSGSGRMLWALAVVLVVQQLEGSWLSPQMMSDATKMHPVSVLLCVMAGGAAFGIAGILFAVPVFLCLRASLRVYAQHQKWCVCAAAMKDVKER